MAATDSRVDEYIEQAAPFARPVLRHLRKIVHTACPAAKETIKWNFPHFDHQGILCGMAAFQQHCAFGFWKAELMFDEDKLADRKAMGHFGRITSLDDLPNDRTLIAYVRKAARLNEAGAKVPRLSKRTRSKPKVPDYFQTALNNNNTKARRTFENLAPGQQREYVQWLSDAKRVETRKKRLQMSILWLSQGKPHNWKYLPKYRYALRTTNTRR